MNLSSIPGRGLRAGLTALASLVIAGTSDAAIAQRGSATTTLAAQSSTSISLNKPSGVVAGDVLLAVITKNVQTIGTTGPPSGWTQVDARGINTASANNKTHGSVFYRVADGTEGAIFSFTLGGGTANNVSNGASGALLAFSGVNTAGGVAPGGGAGPFDVAPGTITVGGAASSSVTANGITTQSPNAAVVMLGMVGGNIFTWSGWNTTSPGSLTEIAEAPRGGSCAAASWAIKPAAGATGNGTVTLSSAAQIPAALLIALKEFASSPGPVINSFTVSPTAIAAGGSATLSWNVTGADTVTIDNGVGSVAAGSGSQSVSPAATTTYTLSATNGDGTNTATATGTVAPAGSYRYFRFVPVALRDNGTNSIQISEFQMLSGGTRLTGATASNPGGNSPGSEGAAQANDNNLGSKWLDFTKFTPLILDFGTFQSANGYRIGTANDSDDRDPVSWRVEGSINGSTWVVLDEQTNFALPTARQIYVPDFAISSGPAISFSASPTTVVEGSSSTLTWTVVGADAGTISIDNGISNVAASGSLSVSPAATTTYTISATGADTTNTKTATVTVIPPPPPAITFTASPPAILAGGSSTLSWNVTGATTVSINNGIGTVAASGTQSVSPAATTTYTLSATGPGGSNTGTATVTVVPPGSYRYYRFVPVALRDTGAADSVQISEFQMLDGGNRIAGATASNPGGSSPGGEGPDKGNDNDLSSKWLDFTKTTPLILDFGAPTATTGYRIGSAGDADERDPVSWRVEGSHDGTAWILLDEKTGYAFPTARDTYLPDFFFNRAPVFTGFAASTPYETQAEISKSKILLNASDPDGDTVTITTAGPATAQGGTAALQATTILYTPAAGYTGADSFSITLSDGRGGLTTGTVTVTVDANGGIGPNAPTITLGTGTAQVLFHGIPGRNYEAQRSTNLVDWTVLSTVTAAPNGDIPYTDTNPPVGTGFYRMRVP